MFDIISKLLEALYFPWSTKIIRVSSVGENTMSGHFSGLVIRMCAAEEHDVLRIWYPPHQIDSMTKRSAEHINGGTWVNFVNTLSGSRTLLSSPGTSSSSRKLIAEFTWAAF